MKIVISGLTACGKTYHSVRLASKYGLKYISGSTILQKLSGVTANKPHFWVRKYAFDFAKDRIANPSYDIKTDKKILKILTEEDDILVDSLTAPYLYKGEDLIRICLIANTEARTEMAYLSTRSKPFNKKELAKRIKKKDRNNIFLFKKLYGIDITDLSIFNLCLDISESYKSPSEVFSKLAKFVKDIMILSGSNKLI